MFPFPFDETNIHAHSFADCSEEQQPHHQGHFQFEGYYMPGERIATSPSLLPTAALSSHGQLDVFGSGAIDITDPLKDTNVTVGRTVNNPLVEAQQGTMSITAVKSPAASVSKPVIKSARRRYSPAKWTEIQSIVQSLYLDQGHSLPETMRILEEEQSFKTSYVQTSPCSNNQRILTRSSQEETTQE